MFYYNNRYRIWMVYTLFSFSLMFSMILFSLGWPYIELIMFNISYIVIIVITRLIFKYSIMRT